MFKIYIFQKDILAQMVQFNRPCNLHSCSSLRHTYRVFLMVKTSNFDFRRKLLIFILENYSLVQDVEMALQRCISLLRYF